MKRRSGVHRSASQLRRRKMRQWPMRPFRTGVDNTVAAAGPAAAEGNV